MKIIACVTMLIDHFAFFYQEQLGISENLYCVLRGIGRISFPIFAFLLVESFYHTKSKWKHLFRILFIGVLSEIPYNIIRDISFTSDKYQNVCFTLAVGFLMLMLLDKISDITFIKKEYGLNKYFAKVFNWIFCFTFKFLTVYGACMITVWLKTDYSFIGVLLIAMFYHSHHRKEIKCGKTIYNSEITKNFAYTLSVATFSIIQIMLFANELYLCCLISLLPIYLSNGILLDRIKCKREKCENKFAVIGNKILHFTLRYFYPIHLTLLIVIRMIMTW